MHGCFEFAVFASSVYYRKISICKVCYRYKRTSVKLMVPRIPKNLDVVFPDDIQVLKGFTQDITKNKFGKQVKAKLGDDLGKVLPRHFLNPEDNHWSRLKQVAGFG